MCQRAQEKKIFLFLNYTSFKIKPNADASSLKASPARIDFLDGLVKYISLTLVKSSIEQLITRCLISSLSFVEISSRLKLKSFLASPTGERGLSIEDTTPRIASSRCCLVIDVFDHSMASLKAEKVSVHLGSL